MTRDTHSERSGESIIPSYGQLRALLLTMVLLLSAFSMPVGTATAQTNESAKFTDDFEDYSVGTTSPGDWNGGEVVADPFQNNQSLDVDNPDNPAFYTGSDFAHNDYEIHGYFKAEGGASAYVGMRAGSRGESNQPYHEIRLADFDRMDVTSHDGSATLEQDNSDITFNAGSWYEYSLSSDGNEITGTLTEVGNESNSATGTVTQTATFTGSVTHGRSNNPSQYDATRAGPYGDVPEFIGQTTGSVTDADGNPIDGATVTFTNTSTGTETTTQTGSGGEFSVEVASGEYDIEISKAGYQTVTETRDVTEGEDLGTFELGRNQLDLKFNRYVEPNSSTPYEVEFVAPDGTTEDVTANVSMNSSNTSIATVNESTMEIVGEEGVNGTSVITANYTVDGETFTDTRNVTVATKTVDNLEILPGTWRFSAVLDDITMQVLLVAIGAGIVATRAASSWAGLGAMELVIIIGWFGDWVPIGIAMLGLFTALFIGLNLAANIDYSVRR